MVVIHVSSISRYPSHAQTNILTYKVSLTYNMLISYLYTIVIRKPILTLSLPLNRDVFHHKSPFGKRKRVFVVFCSTKLIIQVPKIYLLNTNISKQQCNYNNLIRVLSMIFLKDGYIYLVQTLIVSACQIHLIRLYCLRCNLKIEKQSKCVVRKRSITYVFISSTFQGHHNMFTQLHELYLYVKCGKIMFRVLARQMHLKKWSSSQPAL